MRYRLQRKESIAMPNVLGNKSQPVYTYRWKDIAASDDKAVLENIFATLPQDKYRIEDTRGAEDDGHHEI